MGAFLSPGAIWQCLVTFCLSQLWMEEGMLLTTLQCTREPHNKDEPGPKWQWCQD